MKKVLATLGLSLVVAGAAVTNVSAEEYKVQKGDSLWDIANEYKTTVDDLIDINDLDSNVIHPDQKLSIDNKETYKVESGDTLSGISKKFDVTVEDIKDWNDLDSDLIVIGQELELEGVTVEQNNNESADNNQPSNDNTQDNSNNEGKQKSEKSESAKAASTKAASTSDDAPEGKTINVSATAYTATCEGCSGVTSTGIDLGANPDAKVIAVDPDVIPLGSEVYVEGYGKATAADVGSAINGNKIDVHVSDQDEANDWGVKDVDVTILD